MLVDWIIELLVELPFVIDLPFRSVTCPKCGGRLKYLKRRKTGQVQCVMCERIWQKGKGAKLRPVDAGDK